jgi:hypothetical protein
MVGLRWKMEVSNSLYPVYRRGNCGVHTIILRRHGVAVNGVRTLTRLASREETPYPTTCKTWGPPALWSPPTEWDRNRNHISLPGRERRKGHRAGEKSAQSIRGAAGHRRGRPPGGLRTPCMRVHYGPLAAGRAHDVGGCPSAPLKEARNPRGKPKRRIP